MSLGDHRWTFETDESQTLVLRAGSHPYLSFLIHMRLPTSPCLIPPFSTELFDTSPSAFYLVSLEVYILGDVYSDFLLCSSQSSLSKTLSVALIFLSLHNWSFHAQGLCSRSWPSKEWASHLGCLYWELRWLTGAGKRRFQCLWVGNAWRTKNGSYHNPSTHRG